MGGWQGRATVKLSKEKIWAILRGDFIPPPEQLEEINRRAWRDWRYRKIRRVAINYRLWHKSEGFSIALPYVYLQPQPLAPGSCPCLRVLLLGDELYQPLEILADPDTSPERKKKASLYINFGWCDAVPLWWREEGKNFPLPWEAVMGGGEAHPRPYDVVKGKGTQQH